MGGGRRSMAAWERVSRRGLDGISRRLYAAVPDPWTIDTGCELDHGVDSDTGRIGSHCIQAAALVDAPVDERGDDDQVGHGKQRDHFHEGCQRIVDAVTEILKEQKVLNVLAVWPSSKPQCKL